MHRSYIIPECFLVWSFSHRYSPHSSFFSQTHEMKLKKTSKTHNLNRSGWVVIKKYYNNVVSALHVLYKLYLNLFHALQFVITSDRVLSR